MNINETNDNQLLETSGYDLAGNIGEGAYSKVKLFYSRNLDHHVAVKIIDKRSAAKEFVKKFLPREIDILHKINHPNIVDCYEILATSDGRIFIILEYTRYDDLLRFIQNNGSLDEMRVKHLFGHLAEAVGYLHKNGIVHRDLKCENLLLTDSSLLKSRQNTNNLRQVDMSSPNKIKPLILNPYFDPNSIKLLVTDFGFARKFESNEKSKTFCGSAAYAAPEITQGKPYKLTGHDMWSLGIILYIMVTGSMPYDDSNIQKMIRIQLNHKIGFKSDCKLSKECKKLITSLIEPNVEKRFSIEQVLNDPWLLSRPIYPSGKDDRPLSSILINRNKQGILTSDDTLERLVQEISPDMPIKSKIKKLSNSDMSDILNVL